jgi:hypothetical protein
LFTNSRPPRKSANYGAISSVAEIAGKAYAVGLRGIVYRLSKPNEWIRIDDGLVQTFNGQAIHGFSEREIYAVGRKGQLYEFDGRNWSKRELPVNLNLTEVKCAQNGLAYIAGHAGTLLRGRHDIWEIIETETDVDLWDLEWFNKTLYVSSLTGLFRLEDDQLIPIDFGKNSPKTTFRLSAAEGVLWSIGNSDVMSFDGAKWSRVV